LWKGRCPLPQPHRGQGDSQGDPGEAGTGTGGSCQDSRAAADAAIDNLHLLKTLDMKQALSKTNSRFSWKNIKAG
jgi:hypothetical protein